MTDKQPQMKNSRLFHTKSVDQEFTYEKHQGFARKALSQNKPQAIPTITGNSGDGIRRYMLTEIAILGKVKGGRGGLSGGWGVGGGGG